MAPVDDDDRGAALLAGAPRPAHLSRGFRIPPPPPAMKPSLDRTVKLIWLAIGALLLLLLAGGGVMMLAQAVGNAGAGREAARVVSDTAARVREAHPVRYGMPDSIPGTATR